MPNKKQPRPIWTLEKFKAPRRISAAEQRAITASLRVFAGTKFDGGIPPGDPESAHLLRTIETALNAAGWSMIDWSGGDLVYTDRGHPNAGLVSVSNVIIAAFPGQHSAIYAAAKALVENLNAADIAAQSQDATGITNNTTDAVHILIGRKM